MNLPIEIKSSKKKLFWISLSALLLVLTSVFILYKADTQVKWNPLLLKIVAITGMVFFGYALVIGIKKLLGKEKPGLIIDEERIYLMPEDISYSVAKKDIVRISETTVFFTNTFILIFVQNGESYIQNEKRRVRKQLMKTNLAQYGTPFIVSTNTLQINHRTLKKMLEETIKKDNS